jgi:hypothetical protein
MAQHSYIAARVESELAEGFRLAAELRGLSTSAALRACMREFVAAAAAPLNGSGRAAAAKQGPPASRINRASTGGAA